MAHRDLSWLPSARRRGGRIRDDLTGVADEALMVRIDNGEAVAFEVMFDRHVDAAYSLAYRVCGRANMAEDIAQEAFLSLWRSSKSYRPARGTVRTWLLGIVHNRAIDMLRRESVRAGRDVQDDEAVGHLEADERTETEAERHEASTHVRAALAALPPEQRRVIELAYFAGLSHREIAALLELAEGTVKGRMRLGLSKLHGALAPYVEEI